MILNYNLACVNANIYRQAPVKIINESGSLTVISLIDKISGFRLLEHKIDWSGHWGLQHEITPNKLRVS